jgi:hypothetical protein
MTPIDTLRKLLEAATPGPWYVSATDFLCSRDRDVVGPVHDLSPTDVALIVALRNAAPALLHVVEAAKAVATHLNGYEANNLPDHPFYKLQEAVEAMESSS